MTEVRDSLASALAAYVPTLLIDRQAAGSLPPVGQSQRLDAALLQINLSGLGTLLERAGHFGRAAALNALFGTLVGYVHGYGGSVVSFGPDALLAAFVQEDAPKMAVSCALAIRSDLSRSGSGGAWAGRDVLSIRMGLSKGSLTLLHVGHAAKKKERPDHDLRAVVFAGGAVDRAAAAARQATSGDIVADAAIAAELGSVLTGQRLDAGFVFLEDMLPLAPPGQIPPAQVSAEALRPYLLPPILRRLEAGDGPPPPALRQVASVFVRFAAVDIDTPNGSKEFLRRASQAHEIIRGHGGSLLDMRASGGGVLLHAVFGAPTTITGPQRQALSCALALHTLDDDPDATGQQTGVASGHVFTGPVGSEARQTYMVIGEAISLSAHLAEMAGPGHVLLDAETHRRTFEAFDAHAHQNVRVKGKAHPQTVYRLKGVRAHRTGFEARYLSGKHSLIERDQEVSAIARAVERALAGEGQVLVITGEAGSGKSRLTEEVIRLWLPEGRVCGGGCPPHAPESAYLPWQAIWRDLLVMGGGAESAAWQARLADLCPDQADAPALLAPVLGLEVDDEPSLAGLDARSRRERRFEVASAALRKLALERPLLLVLSDLQWSDESSLRLIERVAQRCGDVPLLLCLAHRPVVGGLPGLEALFHATYLDAGPLSGEAGWALIEALTRDLPRQRWPAPLRTLLEERLGITRGRVNPLLVEETVESLIEAGALSPDGDGFRVEAGHEVALFDSPSQAIAARLERLDRVERDLLGLASVIESPVPEAVLIEACAGNLSAGEAVARLERLDRLGWLATTHTEPTRTVHFRHNLLAEVVYDGLAPAQRRAWHARVGEILENGAGPEGSAAALARHFDLGEQPEKASHYSLLAGELAQDLCDYDLALGHYQVAMRHLAALPPDAAHPLLTRLRLRRGRILLEEGHFDELQAEIQEVRRVGLYHDDVLSVVQAGLLDGERCRQEGHYPEMARVAGAVVQLAAEEGFHEEMDAALRLQDAALRALGLRDRR